MVSKQRQQQYTEGLAKQLEKVKDERVNPYILTQRQHLIQKLNDLLYKTQRNILTDEEVSDILKRLSHV